MLNSQGLGVLYKPMGQWMRVPVIICMYLSGLRNDCFIYTFWYIIIGNYCSLIQD